MIGACLTTAIGLVIWGVMSRTAEGSLIVFALAAAGGIAGYFVGRGRT